MPELTIPLILVCAAVAFTLSASAGLGGSLVLVPALALLLGPKEGIALAALLLGCNNVAKVVVYRDAIPWVPSLGVVVLTVVGAALGAGLMVAAPRSWVSAGIVVALATSFVMERIGLGFPRLVSAPALAFLAGTTSGFSGTSGPLKGAALRMLGLPRIRMVGAASMVSLVGDLTKVAIFSQAALFGKEVWIVLAAALPLCPLAAIAGRRLNTRLGERGYATLFWVVMAGYSLRMLLR